ncbi:MAG TPA: type II toxin-antitoxin system antitoxin SocA domain-containing protein [Flavisolibacter sp.]|jgi:uncharacterized phage-associated protein
MAYPASIIAQAFVQKGIDEGNFVTQMKLQKMVFFAHGYHLAKYGEPLVSEKFEAWKFGPVVQDIYQTYKLYGSDPIMDTYFLPKPPADARQKQLSEAALEAIEYTWKVTKPLSANQLSYWSHVDGSPWAAVYDPAKNSAIPNESIKEYFQKLLSREEA